MHRFKLTPDMLRQVEQCFKAVYNEHGTEDRILIYANARTGELSATRVPMMRSAVEVMCDVDLNFVDANNDIQDLVFDLHSHHVMGAFWSRVDNEHERWRGPIYGVFSWRGGVDQWLFRFYSGEGYNRLDPRAKYTRKGYVDLNVDEVIAA